MPSELSGKVVDRIIRQKAGVAAADFVAVPIEVAERALAALNNARLEPDVCAVLAKIVGGEGGGDVE